MSAETFIDVAASFIKPYDAISDEFLRELAADAENITTLINGEPVNNHIATTILAFRQALSGRALHKSAA